MGKSQTWNTRALSDVIIRACGRFGPEQIFEAVVDGTLIELGINAAEPADEDLEQIANPIRAHLAETILRSPPFHDILGEAYMALRSNGKAKQLGQWFTPQSVAAAMSELMLSGPTCEDPGQDRLLSMCDPCCGSGVQLLSAAAALHRRGGSRRTASMELHRHRHRQPVRQDDGPHHARELHAA